MPLSIEIDDLDRLAAIAPDMPCLHGLSDEFTPEDDLYLAENIVARTDLGLIADQLDCGREDVLNRWSALVAIDRRDLRQGVPLELQENLLAALRHRVSEASVA